MFDNLDDPKQQALLAAAFGLLGGRGGKGFRGFAQDAGQAGLLGMQSYNQASILGDRRKEEEQQRAMRDLQMSQMKQGMADQDFARQIAPNFFQPQNAPADGVGPVAPPKADFGGYGQALAARNPQMGLPYIQAAMKDESPLVLSPGQVAFDKGTGQPKFSAPEKAKFQDGDTRELKAGSRVLTQEYRKGEWKTIGEAPLWKPDEGPKPQFVPEAGGYVNPPNAKGGPSFTAVPGFPASQKNQASEAELVAAGFASRMAAANDLLTKLPTEATPGIRQTIANNKYPTLAPFVSSPEQQQYRQAQEDWVRAKLRKESGAVIADEEMAREIRVYFPQPGDKEAVIKQKAEARERANNAMMLAAGKARGQIPHGGDSIDSLVNKYLKR